VASSRSKSIWDELGLYAKKDGTVGARNLPEFRDEAEEADWWYRTSDAISDFAVEHGLHGKRPARGVARPTSIRLPAEDLERARKLAAHKGIGYQTYLKMLLHEALGREERRSKVA
jgi:predicted DNA binding CopG/RHH family protein